MNLPFILFVLEVYEQGKGLNEKTKRRNLVSLYLGIQIGGSCRAKL